MLKSLVMATAAGFALGTMTPEDVRVCSTHLHCREFGDEGATCSQSHQYGQCSCSTGHKKISSGIDDVGLVVKDYNTHMCVVDTETTATSLARVIPSFLTVTFPDAVCSDYSSVSAALQTAVEEIITGHTVTITQTCSQTEENDVTLGLTSDRGVNAAIFIETLTVGDLYKSSITRFKELLYAKLTAAPAEGETENLLKTHLGTAAIKNHHLYTVTAVPLMCPNEDQPGQLTATVFVEAQQTAAQASFNRRECKSLTCSSEYELINGVCIIPTPTPPTPDDDLNDGQLAAIIVGSSVALIAIVAGIIIYCCCKKRSEPEQDPEDESGDEKEDAEKETSPDA